MEVTRANSIAAVLTPARWDTRIVPRTCPRSAELQALESLPVGLGGVAEVTMPTCIASAARVDNQSLLGDISGRAVYARYSHGGRGPLRRSSRRTTLLSKAAGGWVPVRTGKIMSSGAAIGCSMKSAPPVWEDCRSGRQGTEREMLQLDLCWVPAAALAD